MSEEKNILVSNPVLTGFNPDPSICRVGDDFYIAVSSFQYFPGVPLYHSRNLQKWELIGYALDRQSQLNMHGNPTSGGIWAPCLTYSEGLFYLIYTDVKELNNAVNGGTAGFKDTHNYLVTAENIQGPWSEPIYLNSSGFDPSLFHDEDGRKWLVNMLWDYRLDRNNFAGIVLQEYSPQEKKLTGPIRNIFPGTDLALTEAPHLYKRKGWYYLMTAEGGTAYAHAVTLARSRTLEGPYEVHPQKHLLTSVKDYGKLKGIPYRAPFTDYLEVLKPGLQKAGHGSMVPWTEDEWVLAHLCGRPLEESGRCPLGRETALQKIVWKEDDWPYMTAPGPENQVTFTMKEGVVPESETETSEVWRDDFDKVKWDLKWNTLRIPANDRFSLTDRPGWLRLDGGESPTSRFNQTILLRRVQHFDWSAETLVDFAPEDFQQMAGLTVRYDEDTFSYLRISDNDGIRSLGLIDFDLKHMSLPLGKDEIPLGEGPVSLGVDVKGKKLQYRYRQGDGQWLPIGPELDASHYSDDYTQPIGFTGCFVGLLCCDLSGRKHPAWFDFLAYREV